MSLAVGRAIPRATVEDQPAEGAVLLSRLDLATLADEGVGASSRRSRPLGASRYRRNDRAQLRDTSLLHRRSLAPRTGSASERPADPTPVGQVDQPHHPGGVSTAKEEGDGTSRPRSSPTWLSRCSGPPLPGAGFRSFSPRSGRPQSSQHRWARSFGPWGLRDRTILERPPAVTPATQCAASPLAWSNARLPADSSSRRLAAPRSVAQQPGRAPPESLPPALLPSRPEVPLKSATARVTGAAETGRPSSASRSSRSGGR